MDYPKLIVYNQKEESISKQRVKNIDYMCLLDKTSQMNCAPSVDLTSLDIDLARSGMSLSTLDCFIHTAKPLIRFDRCKPDWILYWAHRSFCHALVYILVHVLSSEDIYPHLDAIFIVCHAILPFETFSHESKQWGKYSCICILVQSCSCFISQWSICK